MSAEIHTKIRINFITALLGVVFAIFGFSYNAWRMEVTEDNSNIRTASFEVLKELSKLEQNIYALHYDKNNIEGNPRKGWVSVGLIHEMSVLISKDVHHQTSLLKTLWNESWKDIEDSREATDQMVASIDAVRSEITSTLTMLK